MYQFVRRRGPAPGPARASQPSVTIRHAARPAADPSVVRRHLARVETPESTRIRPATPAALQVGRADDPAEADADRFAAGLNADLNTGPSAVLRRSSAETSDIADPLGGTTIDSATTSTILSASGGTTLPDDVRAAAEARSGRDLSAVRIHVGSESARISRSLQATAFTSGTNIFLGADAARPGTADGNTLLGHELGHVVQQGGGVVSRQMSRRPRPQLRPQADLRPLTTCATPSVQRLLGFGGSKKNSGAVRAGTAPASAPQKSTSQQSDAKAAAEQQMLLRRRIGSFELTMTKLRKHKGARGQAQYSVAYALNAAAEKELLELTGGKPGKGKGTANADERKRLHDIVVESQLIYDEFRVAKTKEQAGQIYSRAGQQGNRGAGGKGFQHVDGGASEFDPLGSQSTDVNPLTGESASDIAVRLDQAGKALGLSKAEVAAIATFTAFDYRYINPATANDDGWMKANIPDASDSERASMKSEGTLHAGMAMEGLNKLPVWTGRTFRGEKLKPEEVAMYFDIKANNTVAIKKPSFARSAISSTSKSEKSAADFQFVGRPVPEGGRFVIWENAITNGRDIEELSVNKREQEVATLPGAQFRILSARLETSGVIRAKVVQVK